MNNKILFKLEEMFHTSPQLLRNDEKLRQAIQGIFNISIDNGVMHMLTLASPKLIVFFNKSSEKFKPIKSNSFVYDCEKNKETIDNLDSQKIIEFIEKNI